MKKKLLIILGAGSSIESGMPLVGDLDARMKQWASHVAATQNYPDYFEILRDRVSRYYKSGSGPRPDLPNFEKILGEMIALSHWMVPPPRGDPLRQTVSTGKAPSGIPCPDGKAPFASTIEIEDQKDCLLSILAKHMRQACLAKSRPFDVSQRYRIILDTLRKEFEVGIYNLNYDTAALEAFPGAFTGFSEDGSFDPISVHHRSEWNFVYHLHGSVHHSLETRHGGAICWKQELRDHPNFFDTPVTSANDKRSEGKSFSRATLIAGGHKLDQLLVEPFQSLHAAFVRHVYAADAFLIGGYGFADVHINRALQNRWGTVAGRKPVMVLDHAEENTDPMQFRMDTWANGLTSTLIAPRDFFGQLERSGPPRPYQLAQQAQFEVSSVHPVAIWYGGFTAASQALDRIIPWLSGQPNHCLA